VHAIVLRKRMDVEEVPHAAVDLQRGRMS